VGARLLSGDVFLERHWQVADPLGDGEQVGHRRLLFDLLLEEPLDELLAEVVALLPSEREQLADLAAYLSFLVEREANWADVVFESCGRGRDFPEPYRCACVEQVLDHHHRVLAFLERLAVEEAGQLRQALGLVVGRDCDVLVRCREFVRDLVV
jgi:hypothetical protein